MRSISVLALGLACAAVALAGCAGRPARGTVTADRVCVRVHQINSFETLDDRHVVVKVSASRYYLLTVDNGCAGLGFAGAITIAEPSTRVCGDGFSFLSFRHPGSGSTRCRIQNIETVEDSDAARVLIESRAAE